MHASAKPLIHLWIYNHPFYGISDQVDFFVMALSQHGYAVTVGRQPSRTALNVVIENFTAETRKTLVDFCKSERKRVAVIMTEHLDFDGDQIFIHGDPLWSENDYMHPAVQVARIKNLMDCLPYIRCFFVLGDLPALRNMSLMLPGIDVRSIPFPKLDIVSNDSAEMSGLIAHDLLFTGVMTAYRVELYELLEKSDLSVTCPEKFVSRKLRDTLSKSAKLVLNLPQRADWRWLSLMRIIAALRSGRATVSLGTKDTSRISACCLQLDMADQGWIGLLKERISNWQSLYRAAHEDYMCMAAEFERGHPFPCDAFEYWAITDLVRGSP